MFSFLSTFFSKKQIDCFAAIPLEDCRIVRPYLLDKHGIQRSGTVIVMAVPYYTRSCDDPRRNLSAYATSRDYHTFYKMLFEELIPCLQDRFPQFRFAGFADHSPIDELDAAVRAGLGVYGKNHLVITPKYSSYVFLGELITDAIIPCVSHPVRTCEDCGACMRICPSKECGGCLSALTQKKGILNDEEKRTILKYESVWGCDICQETCPHTIAAKRNGTVYSPIPFFQEASIPELTLSIFDEMSDTEFAGRAYAWRGRDTIRRNLLLFEEEKGEHKC
ncbi:MAG: epoxyqueuosine reductase [Ruminococcaceae bacterium]|nr:epoxyqueuosine reductase [Oscillospiraceae bacterium]